MVFGLSLGTVKRELKLNLAILIDVREQDEWDEHHVLNAIHLPMSILVEQGIPDDLPQDKTLYIHCARGGRAQRIAKAFRAVYDNVTAIKWGPEALC